MQLSEGVFRFFYHNQIKNNHQEKRKIPFCCAKYGSYGTHGLRKNVVLCLVVGDLVMVRRWIEPELDTECQNPASAE